MAVVVTVADMVVVGEIVTNFVIAQSQSIELDNKHIVLTTISGKLRKRWVRLTAGDRVKTEMSLYDPG